jgi:hypothetical protein
MRGPSGQMLDVVTRKTADRFLEERRASGYVGARRKKGTAK